MTLPADHRTRIKICGLTREADVEAAAQAGADAVGFVLYAKSPRHVTPARAAELARLLPPFVTPVLLLVNADDSLLKQAVEAVPHALLQFHGDEASADCDRAGRAYLRAARMAPGFDLLNFALGYPNAQALLVDAHVDGYGGGGQVFDWSLLPRGLPRPMILSGGLHPGNVADGVRQVRPWGVDVSSGVESGKGLKDTALVRQFCQAVRAADRLCAEPLAGASQPRASEPMKVSC
ncbi:phosphoribosylanthranilate isomerase [Aquabacterium soli]|uniref:N-(5'-phosphoribosyl)anthranilate isomerase n=1 Tax=Aquabacterium soli TaxID=2493092 RepID=A0A426V6S3_9BURK|nr:phosphoribosylanthranilate isomerase [Aquabacterium soli]RRS02500.1 phosphoribosylanthranilate isomerase [Aquabacterium soli]